MSSRRDDEINVLKLTLHGRCVAYLAGYQNGRNVLSFSDEFKRNSNRATLSLITHPQFPRADQLMEKPWTKNQRLHPMLSNLLPEGSLRELVAQRLKVHVDSEFNILSYLGEDLPGALVVEPMAPEDVPESVLVQLAGAHGKAKAVEFNRNLLSTGDRENKFSLAGVQIKFSMKEMDGRYNLTNGTVLGDWIIKTPSTKHKDVPLNEYSAMTLAALAGVDIPDIRLIDLSKLDNLPQINLPNEKQAFAIKRFDRHGDLRVHMEDFAQVLVKYPHEKYNSANYEQIGNIIFKYCGDGIADAQQFARRLLVNILLANGDAHLKNWSLLYLDKITPRLSPAYDILTTSVYIDDEKHLALNLGKTKQWQEISLTQFQAWAIKSKIPWRAIKPHLDDVINKAKSLWPESLTNLPMNEEHKIKLKQHWRKLHPDFRF